MYRKRNFPHTCLALQETFRNPPCSNGNLLPRIIEVAQIHGSTETYGLGLEQEKRWGQVRKDPTREYRGLFKDVIFGKETAGRPGEPGLYRQQPEI